MDYRNYAANIKEIIKLRNSRNENAQVNSFFDCCINRKFNILAKLKCTLFFVLLFPCFVTSGYAVDVTLKWTPNNEPNLAGYKVFYRQEGQSYNYFSPYWETIDPVCTIYDLDETKTYYFTVRAYNTEGFQSSNSNEVCLEAETTTGN